MQGQRQAAHDQQNGEHHQLLPIDLSVTYPAINRTRERHCDRTRGRGVDAGGSANQLEHNKKCNNRQEIAQEFHTRARCVLSQEREYRIVLVVMTRRLIIHPTHPQPRLLSLAANAVRADGVVIYPTDSTYALGCAVQTRDGPARIHRIRGETASHYLTLVCRDLAELGTYARVSNTAFRLLRALTPGPFTFILQGSRELPKRLLDPKRKTIGLRIPAHPVTQGLLAELQQPMLSATLPIEPETLDAYDSDHLAERYLNQVDLFIDAGNGGRTPTTIIDLSGDEPRLVRRGLGDVAHLFDEEPVDP